MTYFSYKYYYVQEKNQCQILAECLSRENDPNKYHRSGQCRCGTDEIFASSNAEYFLLLFCVSLVNAIFYCYNTFGDRLPAALVYFYDNLWLLVLVWNWDPTFWEVSQNGYQPHGKRVASHEKELLVGTRSDKTHHRFLIPDHAEMLTILLWTANNAHISIGLLPFSILFGITTTGVQRVVLFQVRALKY